VSTYLLRRFLFIVPTLLGILSVVFAVIHLAPGSPAEILLGDYASPDAVAALEEQLGLKKPLWQQYGLYIWNVMQGDFGRSFATNREVLTEVLKHIPYTLELAGVAVLISILIGIPAGAIAAVKGGGIDRISMVLALLLASMPLFWLGILLMLLFSIKLGWFPLIGGGDPYSWSAIKYLVLPALALSGTPTAFLARMTRSSMLEIIRKDFIRVAHAKGLKKRVIIFKHVLKNAMIPIITVIGLNMGQLLGGGVVIEIVFARPGLGKLLVDSIFARDYMQVQGTVVVIACLFVLINLVVDMAYSVFDPRIRYQ
jgi:ABC-type dipeptide/oligopeptide/nickel transport system permease component